MSLFKLYLELDQLPQSLNKSLRTNRYKNNSKNKRWDNLIKTSIFEVPKEPLKKANITLVRHSYRMLDYDGCVGSMKPVVDALVEVGILEDDNWNVTGKWNVDQKFRPKKDGPLLEILIQECPL